MNKNATEIMNDFFTKNPNGHIKFGWGPWDKVDICKKDNDIIFDVEIRGFCWSDGHRLFNYNNPKELAELKTKLFVSMSGTYYGHEFAGLNDKNFVEALECHTKD